MGLTLKSDSVFCGKFNYKTFFRWNESFEFADSSKMFYYCNQTVFASKLFYSQVPPYSADMVVNFWNITVFGTFLYAFFRKLKKWTFRLSDFSPKMVHLRNSKSLESIETLISCEDYQFLNSMSEKIHAFGHSWFISDFWFKYGVRIKFIRATK